MQFYRDELRRALRDADAAQREVMPRWRDAMSRALSRPDRVDPRVTAAAVGVPGRRQVLRLGGMAVLGSAVFAACGGDEDEESTRAAETGEVPEPVDPSTTTTFATAPSTTLSPFQAAEAAKTNLSILRTAASIEYLAVSVYDSVAAEPEKFGLDPSTDVPLANLFSMHHGEHADSLNDLAEGIEYEEGGESVQGTAWTTANPYLAEALVRPSLPALQTREATLRFARDLEDLATGTYTEVTGLLTEIVFRTQIMNIGAVEARHAAALSIALEEPGAPFPFVVTRNRAPDTVLIAPTDEEEEEKEAGGGEAEG